MSRYELLTLLISLLAVIISTVSLVRGHRLAVRQAALQRTQAELAALQHELLLRDEQDREKADLRADLVPTHQNNFKLVVQNVGACAARNIRLEPTNQAGVEDALTRSDLDEVFPVSELLPGQEVRVQLYTHLGTRWPLKGTCTWDDDSGENQTREIRVAP